MCFVDDCLVYSPNDWKLHLQHIRAALVKLRNANLSLKLSKCKFGFNEVPFLGHIIGKDGLKMDPAKVKAIQTIAQPKTKTNVRSFLGLAGYYKHFIRDFALMARPISNLTRNEFPDKNIPWSEECEASFQKLKAAMSSYPVLQFPYFDDPFILETDASKTRIAGILMQERKNGKVVISYFSRVCSPAESKYPITELEMLGVVNSIRHF
jgi:hypothetical protein